MASEKLRPTFREFYKNPSGKSIPPLMINAARAGYEKRYEILKNRIRRKFPVQVYVDSERSVYFHVKIPSDTRPEMDYDVVIHLLDTSDAGKGSLRDWECEFFSNCPSYVFNYAYAYRNKGLFVRFLSEKLGNDVLGHKPTQKNPELEIGWDKSIFYASETLMSNTRYLNRYWVMNKSEAAAFDPEIVFSTIRPFSVIMAQLEHAKSYNNAELYKKINQTNFQKTAEKVSKKVGNTVRNTLQGIKGMVQHRKDSRGRTIGKAKIGSSRKRRK